MTPNFEVVVIHLFYFLCVNGSIRQVYVILLGISYNCLKETLINH